MTTASLELFIKTLNTVIYILGLADFCLGGCINSVSRSKGQFTFSHGLATCSFGGLTRDVLLTPFFTGVFILPGLMTSTETWFIAVTVVGVFSAIYKFGKYDVFEHDSFILPFTFLDTLGLGNFTVIGVLVAVKLGHSSVVIQILYGLVTATGGGVFSILMWTHDKRKHLRENIWYYTTAVISSGVASIGISTGFNHEAVYLACSAFCATVYVVRKTVAEGVRYTYYRSCYYKINTALNYYLARIRNGEYFGIVNSVSRAKLKLFHHLLKKHQAKLGMHGVYCSC